MPSVQVGRRRSVRCTMIGIVVAIHVSFLMLSALPSSLFVERLYPFYGWYPSLSGQFQRWAMYAAPDHDQMEIDLVATLPDGSHYRPWGTSKAMSPRKLYLLESMFSRNDFDLLAKRLMIGLASRFPIGVPPPTSMSIRRTSVPISPFAESFGREQPSGPPEVREITFRW